MAKISGFMLKKGDDNSKFFYGLV